MKENIPLASLGVLAPGSAHARPSAQPLRSAPPLSPFAQPPINNSEIFLVYVSAESPSNIPTNPSKVISEVFGTLGQLLKIPLFVRPNIP